MLTDNAVCAFAVVQEIYAVLMVFLHDMVFCFVKAAILQSCCTIY